MKNIDLILKKFLKIINMKLPTDKIIYEGKAKDFI